MSAAAGPAIDVHGLNKSFGDKHAVIDLSLQVQRGEIFGFLGPNGSGKTTTIRMMCGLLTPDGGSGTCLGFDIRREADEIKRHVGYMTQRFSYWEDLSLRENLDFVARVYEMPNRAQAVAQALAGLGLEERADQLAGALSGGWKQRLALAACMLHQPRLLLLDEPTAGMGDQETQEITQLVRRLHSDGNFTIVLIEHDMRVVFHLADRITVLDQGSLLAEGSPEEIASNEAVQAAYLGNAA